MSSFPPAPNWRIKSWAATSFLSLPFAFHFFSPFLCFLCPHLVHLVLLSPPLTVAHPLGSPLAKVC